MEATAFDSVSFSESMVYTQAPRIQTTEAIIPSLFHPFNFATWNTLEQDYSVPVAPQLRPQPRRCIGGAVWGGVAAAFLAALRFNFFGTVADMRTLLYKRTHKGDPDPEGRFGIHDCMVRLRPLPFDAVIGIGGVSGQPTRQGISRKINWVGIGAKKHSVGNVEGPVVTFDHFILFEDSGRDFEAVAPTLAGRMYSRYAPRFLFDDGFSKAERIEIARVLKLAANSPPSKRPPRSVKPSCPDSSRFRYPVLC